MFRGVEGRGVRGWRTSAALLEEGLVVVVEVLLLLLGGLWFVDPGQSLLSSAWYMVHGSMVCGAVRLGRGGRGGWSGCAHLEGLDLAACRSVSHGHSRVSRGREEEEIIPSLL